jgi:hypothetical protein
MGENISVGIETGYRLAVGVRFPIGETFLFSTASRLALEATYPLIQRVPGALSLQGKAVGE